MTEPAEILVQPDQGVHPVDPAHPLTEKTGQRILIALGGDPEGEPEAGGLVVTSVELGTKAETSATTDTGTFSLIQLWKRYLERFTTFLSRFPAALGSALSAASLPVVIASDQAAVAIKAGGAANVATATVSIPTTAGGTALIAARATRRSVTIRNLDADNFINIGVGTITTAMFRLEAGESINIDTTAALKALADTASVDVGTIETYD